ncbi:hypothetical protein [Nocardia sp. CC227C]|uniref:hypothetical protein n=1 Tax=Nocardia sp. CC227C TaxID=3044562 RepID=UPI00278BC414|nr:hypothetical protein [Nocardia sp. CC227C]
MAGETVSFDQLQGKVADGELEFQPKAVDDALRECDSLIGHLLSVRTTLANVTGLADFAGPAGVFSSGIQWTQGFRELARDMEGIVASHLGIVGAMAEVFRSAAKKYLEAEGESEDGFRAALDRKMPTEPYIPGVVRTSVEEMSGRVVVPDAVAAFGTPNTRVLQSYDAVDYSKYQPPADSPRVVWPENPFHKQWDAFYGLGQAIKPDIAVAAAIDWELMRKELDKVFGHFRTGIGTIQNNWRGPAAATAISAVNTYADDTAPLTAAMLEVENGLLRAAGWLRATREWMPESPTPDVRQSGDMYQLRYKDVLLSDDSEKGCLGLALSRIRNACEVSYIGGLVDYNSSLVTLPTPTSPVGAVPAIEPTPEQPSGDPGVPNTPSGARVTNQDTPSGAPTTPTTPTTPATPATPQEDTPRNDSPTDTTAEDQLSELAQHAIAAVQSGVETISQAVQQGLESVQQTVQDVVSDLTTQPTTPVLTTTPSIPAIADQTRTGGGSPLGGSPGGVPPTTNPTTKLFPRATVATETETSSVARAGLPTTTTGTNASTPMGGVPMGAAGQGVGAQGSERKSADYLKRGEHLGEAVGDLPVAVTPVAEK